MSDSKKDVHKLIKELEGKINELPMHIYIMIWSLTEMSERMQRNEKDPKFVEICYPFTSVPLFLPIEAKNLEDLWRKNISSNPDLFPEPPPLKQSGGTKISFSEMKKKASSFGKDLDFALKAIDPKLISPDYLYDYTTELFDSVDSKVTEASGNFGVIALENTMPDPTMIIPTVPPLILPVSSKSIFPMINAVLESLRILNSIIFYIDPMGIGKISRNILTLVMVCLDLARGNIYHAIFTSFGFIGNNPMYLGIILKILRDAIMLVSPDLRIQLRDILFKSSKSFFSGFAIWLFTTMSPQFVRRPIAALFDGVATSIENINNSLDMSEEKIRLSPAGKFATIKLPRIPEDKIPDVNNLYALREAVREPSIYCDPKISVLIDGLRDVPPYALFFDLALIPRKETDEYKEQCKPYAGGDLIENLKKQIEPDIEIKPQANLQGLQSLGSLNLSNPVAMLGSAAAISGVEIPTVAGVNLTKLNAKNLVNKQPLNLVKNATKMAGVEMPKVEVAGVNLTKVNAAKMLSNPLNTVKNTLKNASKKQINSTIRNTLKNIKPKIGTDV